MNSTSDREQLKELRYEYCYRMDNLEPDRFAALFTTDAEYDITDVATGRGREGLRDLIEHLRGWEFDSMAHMCTNPVIEVDGDEASGRWYYTVMVAHGDGTTELGQGSYDETYRRVDGEWLIDTTDVTRRQTVELP
jgi:hypothetical protein